MFDGFPRTVAQAEALEALLGGRGRSIGRVLLIDVPREELVRRILNRSRSEGRADDTPRSSPGGSTCTPSRPSRSSSTTRP